MFEPHDVDVSLEMVCKDDSTLEGFGSVRNLIGALSRLTLTQGPLQGTLRGTHRSGEVRLRLEVQYGNPPTLASVLALLVPDGDGLAGKCAVNLSGNESDPEPCEFSSK